MFKAIFLFLFICQVPFLSTQIKGISKTLLQKRTTQDSNSAYQKRDCFAIARKDDKVSAALIILQSRYPFFPFDNHAWPPKFPFGYSLRMGHVKPFFLPVAWHS